MLADLLVTKVPPPVHACCACACLCIVFASSNTPLLFLVLLLLTHGQVLERRHFYSRHKYEYVSDTQYNKDDFEDIERPEQSKSTVERTPLLAASS